MNQFWPLLCLLLLLTGCRKETLGTPATPPPAGAATLVRVVESVAEGAHQRLRIAVVVSNPGSTPLRAEPPAIQLWAGTNRVPPFLAAGLAPSVVEPGKSVEVETHWWLSAQDASQHLELEVQGVRQPVRLP